MVPATRHRERASPTRVMRLCLRACKTEQATHCTVSADYPNGQHFKTLPVIHFIRWSLQVLYFPMACPLSPLSAAVSPGHSVYLDSFEVATACSGCSRPLATSVWHKHLSLPLDPNYIVFCPMTLGKNQEVTSISERKVRGSRDGGRFEGGCHGRLLASSDSFRHRLQYQITDSTSFSRWDRKQVTSPL